MQQSLRATKGTDVAWGEYAGRKRTHRRQHRLVRDKEDVCCLCESGGRVFGGMRDVSLLVWDGGS